MNKLLLLIIIPFIALSCTDELDFDGQTKKVFKGRLIDEQGNPIEGITVSASLHGGETEVVGTDVSDANGEYLMVFPDAQDERYASLIVNGMQYSGSLSPDYSYYTIYNININTLPDHTLDFGTSMLFSPQNGTTLQ